MKRIFVIDWLLIPCALLTAISGIGLHIAGYGDTHEVWHNWAVFHVISSLLFLVAAIFHVSTHWGWYKGIIKKGLGRKSKITALLSLIFASVVVTGIVLLLCVNGANSPMGLWHYAIGIMVTFLSLIHILNRLPALRNSLKTQ